MVVLAWKQECHCDVCIEFFTPSLEFHMESMTRSLPPTYYTRQEGVGGFFQDFSRHMYVKAPYTPISVFL